MRRNMLSGLMAGGLVLLSASFAPAQTRIGGGTSTGFAGGTGTGGFAGSSGGGFAGSTGGFGGGSATSGLGGGTSSGFAGGSSGFTGSFAGGSGGGFAGSAGGTFTGGTGGSFTGTTGLGGTTGFGTSRTGQVGAGSVFGRFLGNPMAMGLTAGGTSARGTTLVRPFPVALSFGQPLYGTASVTTSPTLGSTALGSTGLGGSSTLNRNLGASSAGMRRAPGYITQPVFDMPARPTMAAVRTDLQGIISRSSRLPSRGNIQVLSEGDTIVLRGQVRDERERRLAEGVLRLSPGVYQVRNELQTTASGGSRSP